MSSTVDRTHRPFSLSIMYILVKWSGSRFNQLWHHAGGCEHATGLRGSYAAEKGAGNHHAGTSLGAFAEATL